MQRLIQFYLALFIACLPCYIIRFHIGHYPTTLLEFLVLGLIGLMAWYHRSAIKLGLLVVKMPQARAFALSQLRQFFQRFRLFWFSMVIFLFAGAVSVVVAHNHRAALGIYKAYVIEPVIVFSLLLSLKSPKLLKNAFILGTSLLLTWLFCLCLSQLLLHRFIFAPDELKLNRATGVFTTANALGLLVGPFGALFSAVAMIEKQALKRTIYIYNVVICAAILILSQSLTALFAFTVTQSIMLFLYLFAYQERWTIWLKRLIGLFLLGEIFGSIAFFTFALPHIAPRVYGSNLPSDSLTIRYYLWRGAITMLFHHPLGAGFSGFPKAYAPYRVYQNDALRRGFADLQLYPHHIVLNFWTETGLIGLGSFFALCYAYFRSLINIRQNPWAIGLIGALLYTLLHGFADVPYFKNDLSMAFWLLCAFAISLSYQKAMD